MVVSKIGFLTQFDGCIFFQIGLVQPPTIPTMTAGLSTWVFLWSTKIRWTFWVNWEMRWTNLFSKPHGGPKSRWLLSSAEASRWVLFFLANRSQRINFVLEERLAPGFQPSLKQWVFFYNHHCLQKRVQKSSKLGKNHYVKWWWKPFPTLAAAILTQLL